MFGKILLGLLAALLTLWGSAAIWIDGQSAGAPGLALAFALTAGALLIWLRPFRRAVLAFVAIFLLVVGWWLGIEPSNERDWQPEVARPPRARIEGDRITISNLRNFRYRSETDFDERWEERTYDLRELRGVDMFLSYWGSPHIAHTITSWDFGEGRHLAISIETRKERGEEYSAVLGFFRRFELYYVIADERDLIGQRTGARGEDVYLYRLTTPVATARAILLDYLKEVNRLADEPRWYNALTHNCTTTIRMHAQQVAPGNPFDWRILVNGHLDELGYERGQVDTSLPFEELRRRSYISEAGRAAADAPDFSVRIRQGIPGGRAASRSSGSAPRSVALQDSIEIR